MRPRLDPRPKSRAILQGNAFIDGELDGRLDLIVVNGHVAGSPFGGKPYQMPSQYYRNLGEDRFIELTAKSLGRYFAGKYLGRGLARLDWNRDSREDAIVSHRDAPVALLTNTTPVVGGMLTVSLCGVVSDRDAIGATGTLRTGSLILVRQLTAGDGFHASNQRILTFGLGAHQRVEHLHIRWPSGSEQEFAGLESGCELLVIEGTDALVLHRPVRGDSAE